MNCAFIIKFFERLSFLLNSILVDIIYTGEVAFTRSSSENFLASLSCFTFIGFYLRAVFNFNKSNKIKCLFSTVHVSCVFTKEGKYQEEIVATAQGQVI